MAPSFTSTELIGIGLGAAAFFLGFVWFIRRKPTQKVEAVVCFTNVSMHAFPPAQVPVTPIRRLTFLAGGKKLTFAVSSETYSKIPKGAKGMLTYRGCELIRFEGDGFSIEG